MEFVILECSFDALMTFANSDVWQAHQVEVDPDVNIDLNLNGGGTDAKNCARVGFDEHRLEFASKFPTCLTF